MADAEADPDDDEETSRLFIELMQSILDDIFDDSISSDKNKK